CIDGFIASSTDKYLFFSSAIISLTSIGNLIQEVRGHDIENMINHIQALDKRIPVNDDLCLPFYYIDFFSFNEWPNNKTPENINNIQYNIFQTKKLAQLAILGTPPIITRKILLFDIQRLLTIHTKTHAR
ncbi:hypothetical protein, partial [Candidatus Symbiopectobacterium sp. NZEC135]|uniref:hypothetical protein n=1 Tax=Candidatus Symbiopectobacterium sp. NZEC135 TaxID=2820471 RepID=UPI0022268417